MTARKNTRRKKTAAARVRPFWLLIAIVAALAAGAGYWAATWPGFFPMHVTVAGNRVVSSDLILERADIAPRENLWLQNVHAAAQRVAQIPYVNEVWIHRSLPANAHIDVTERTPYALMLFGNRTVVVDRNLRVLQAGDSDRPLPLLDTGEDALPIPGVFVKDPKAARLCDDEELLSSEHVVTAQLRYDRFGDLVVTMRNGVRLLLGDDADLQQKVSLIGPILSQVAAQGRRIAAVDLRAPGTPVVVYK